MVRQTWRYFPFNIQNYTPDDRKLCEELECTYICYQDEIGAKNGVLHLQGFVYFSQAIRMAACIKRMPKRAHIDIPAGTAQQGRDYCHKSATKVHGTFVERGIFPDNPGRRSDISALQDSLQNGDTEKQLWDDHMGLMWYHPRSLAAYRAAHPIQRTKVPYVTVLCGPSGTGKTYAVSQLAKDFYPLSYGKTGVWWDGYDPYVHTQVVMNEFRGHWMPYNLLLTILEGFPLYVDTKGGRVTLGNIEKIYITSNCAMDKWYHYNDTDILYSALQRRVNELWWVDTDFWTPGPKQNPPPPLFVQPKNILLSL